jgi:hypothetical protein
LHQPAAASQYCCQWCCIQREKRFAMISYTL